jgi:signal transduction histidine kinase
MAWLYVAFGVLDALIGAGTVVVAVLVWQRRAIIAARYLGLALFALAEWSLAASMEALLPSLAQKILWSKILYIGSTFASLLILLFVLDYVGLGHWITRRLRLALAVVPCTVLIFTWTNELHGLVWPSVALDSAVGIGAVYAHGPVYWFNMVYSLSVLGLAGVLLLWSARRSLGAFRRQAVYVFLALALGLPTGLLYMALPQAFPGIDPSPLSFAIAGVLTAWILLRMRLFDLIPLAYEAMFTHVGEGLVVLDGNDEIVALNPAAQSLLGVSHGVGLIHTASELPAAVQDELHDGANRGRVFTQGNLGRHLEARVYRLPGWSGKTAGRVLELVDVTELVDAESALRALNHDLERQVAERTADLSAREAVLRIANHALQEAGDRLRAEHEMKGQFITAVSHELRTPLTNMTTYLSLLTDGKPERRDHYLETLKQQTALLQQIVEQMLDVAEASESTTPFSLAPLDVNQIAGEEVADMARQSERQNIDLQFHAGARVPLAMGSAPLLHRALVAVIRNALSYTPHGGSVTLASRVVEQADESWVTLSVEDTGLGIESSDLPHIFERCYRGRAAEAMKVSGVGLGLAACQSVMSIQGGKVTVSSDIGRGSCFTLWLPSAEPAQ